jgi:hypothetical protein
MTPQEAKTLALKVSICLRDNPDIECKKELPEHLWVKVSQPKHHCPLCELYFNTEGYCSPCPLGNCGHGSLHDIWADGDGDEDDRQVVMGKIVKLISAWEPKEVKNV